MGLDKAKAQVVTDLPVGQIGLVAKGIFPSIVIPGRAKSEPGIHSRDREYGFGIAAASGIERIRATHR